MNTPHNHDHVMRMVAAIIERGDDQLRDQWSGAPTSDGKWVIQLLLAQLGYTLIVTEDGEVQIWPENNDGSGPYIAGGYRYAEVDGRWYHTEAEYRAVSTVPESELDALERGAARCDEVRPGTLGHQTCWRMHGHAGLCVPQDRQPWSPAAAHGVVKAAGLQEHLDHVVDVLGSVQP